MQVLNQKSKRTKEKCRQRDIMLKTFFLGPQAENISHVLEVFAHLLDRWAQYRRRQFPLDGMSISFSDQTSREFQHRQAATLAQLDRLIHAFENEIPKFSPRYLGHMFSEVSLPALYGSFLSLIHNPNNISYEASRVGLQFETEAIAILAKMIGYKRGSTGHFTSCGSIANLEAALRARSRIATENRIAVFFPRHAHYSWEKIAFVLGLDSSQIYWVKLDASGRMDPKDLHLKIAESLAAKASPAMVVSVFGTTEFGICDPIEQIQVVIDGWKKKGVELWHHVDAAWGGFFACLRNARQSRLSPYIRQNLKALSSSDSMTIDPHKLGYVPYAVGAFLCKNKSLYKMRSIESPYLHKSKETSELWTVEGSRSSQGALSIVLTSKSLPFVPNGFGKLLERNLLARELFWRRLKSVKNLHLMPTSDLNIIGFVIAKSGESTSKVSQRSLCIYQEFSPKNRQAKYIITKTMIDRVRYPLLLKRYVKLWNGKIEGDLSTVRFCLMNPFLTSREPDVDYIDDFVSNLLRCLLKIR